MNTLTTIEVNNFRKILKSETAVFEKTYLHAKSAYEASLKSFIIKNITGNKRHFRELFNDTRRDVCNAYEHEKGSWAVDGLMTLEAMVSDYEFWLEDGCPEY